MTESGYQQSILQKAQLPDELWAPVCRWIDRLDEQDGLRRQQFSSLREDQTTLIRLIASSEFSAGVIHREWDWFIRSLGADTFGSAVDESSLSGITGEISACEDDPESVKSRLRRFRDQQLVHILWRSISVRDEVWDTLKSLSDLADGLIAASVRYAQRAYSARFGEALNAHGEVIPLVILAMGKLGGRELNFSSDVDLIFLYAGEGETDGPRTLSAHEYFTRLSRHIVSLIDEVTQDGFVYRVDTRLRPFGDSGPPVISFAGLENYLLQHGRSWERYAYVKARIIGPSASAAVTDELMASVIDPFVFRRYLDFGVFESLREMKALIAAEVRKRELKGNIKLGTGGIREIEFIAQSLQLVRGGADPELRCSDIRTALTRLGHDKGLGREKAAALLASYYFLRKLENGLQAIRDQQTHDMPENCVDQARLQLVMGFSSWGALINALNSHRKRVSEQFAGVAFRSARDTEEPDLADALAAQWNASPVVADWITLLEQHGFEDVVAIADAVTGFASALVKRNVDSTAAKRVARFMCTFLLLLRERRNPGTVCTRVLSIILQIVRRSAYVALLNENPAVLDRLVGLCAQSAYLAEEIAHFPLLLDELLDPRLYSSEIKSASMREDLDERLGQAGGEDSERKIEMLAQFQRATLFRIAVADFSDTLSIMKVSDRLTELAEIVLETALDIAWADLSGRYGEPVCESGNSVRTARFGVIAYGKLGGMELSYRSDLDLVFLHDSSGDHQETNGENPLENSMFFARLVRRLVHFLTAQTPSGALYEIDTRLRPGGRSGLLVVNIEGFEKYQEDNAWTWEHQALLRGRPVAGSARIAREFERIRADTLQNRVRRDQLLDDVLSMRQKMRKRLDKSSAEQFDLKQGAGGIGDIEFLVQYLVLKNAQNEPALIHYSDNIRQLGTLEAAGYLPPGDVAEIQNTYKTYRLCTHRLALDGKPSLVGAGEFVRERGLLTSLWAREMQ
jgi:[glutamine synthetase] adenylyltransferase / [glutamine synthetase]-adenylyl-L-tyrosine phosphorylase